MEMVKKYFGHAFENTDTLKGLIIKILVYIVVDFICGLVIGIIGKIPVIGLVAGILGSLVGLYFLVSIVLAILNYLKVLK